MKSDQKKNEWHWLTTLFLSLAGLVVSLYSAGSHYKNYTDPEYSSFCALTQAINCDTVAQSPWSIIFGLPVAWWGVLFFLSFLSLLLTAKNVEIRSWRTFFFITLMASLSSLGLAGISIWQIHSLCLACLTVYALVFSATFICWKASRRQKEKKTIDYRHAKNRLPYLRYGSGLSVFLIGLLSLYLFPPYWNDYFESDISALPQGLTEDGHPWIGAKNPHLTIVQFSDYQCFQCAKMHFFLRRLLTSHPDTIRLVHRNYPMDHEVNPQVVPEPFHEGSGNLAKLAILASFRNRFWQMNDLLYAIARKKMQTIPLQDLADATGLDTKELSAALTDLTIQELLRRDIWRGMKLGITGTPAFLIDGKVYQGHIPIAVLNKISTLSKD